MAQPTYTLYDRNTGNILLNRQSGVSLWDVCSEGNQSVNFEMVKQDIYQVLRETKAEVLPIRWALENQEIDGTDCDECLLGTIAKNQGTSYDELPVKRGTQYLAECWFLTIAPGTYRLGAEQVEMTIQWLNEFEG